MAYIYLIPDKQMNRTVCKLPGVSRTVKAKAYDIQNTASARLAPHRNTGNAYVDVHRERGDQYGRIDWFVSLNDPGGNAMAIEFGHKASGRYRNAGNDPAALRILTGSY